MSQFSEWYEADPADIVTPPAGHIRTFRYQDKFWAKLSDGSIVEIGAGSFEPVYGSFRNAAGQVLSPAGETDLVWDGLEKNNVTHTNGAAEITVTKSGVYEIKLAYGYKIVYTAPGP